LHGDFVISSSDREFQVFFDEHAVIARDCVHVRLKTQFHPYPITQTHQQRHQLNTSDQHQHSTQHYQHSHPHQLVNTHNAPIHHLISEGQHKTNFS
jgi:hypothetical protein